MAMSNPACQPRIRYRAAPARAHAGSEGHILPPSPPEESLPAARRQSGTKDDWRSPRGELRTHVFK